MLNFVEELQIINNQCQKKLSVKKSCCKLKIVLLMNVINLSKNCMKI